MTMDKSKRTVTTKFILAVDMGDKTVNSVAVAGTFTSWIVIPLYFENGFWEARLGVNPGTHQFKFVVDGVWIHDDGKHSVANDQGTRNNTLVIFPGANVVEVPSSCLKHVKSGKAFRDSQRREILKPVSKFLEKMVDDAVIEAERTRDQEAIARDIREGLIKNAVKREILTPQKEAVEHPVYDVLDDALSNNPNVELKQIEDFVPKHLQTGDQFVNWGQEKLYQKLKENEKMETNGEGVEMSENEVVKWKVGDECVAKWRGRYWYNGKIVEIIHDQVLVKYLDCGDEDYANLNELKPAGSLNGDGTLKDDHEGKKGFAYSNAGVAIKLGSSSRNTEGRQKMGPGRCAE